ncbi:YggS family pyridoxal phosphate-dependent enzyme [Paracoccus marinaquae]|uniref:Pyridoxal phosphate homeostasis protein n=1 Tax=Paracoccus marinaquae TaxID=2841926 RepID=A0ABS6AM78_9RHOB|nr:YggS family pyridoxal phosphate-dependent enzyme [Paracoccus marinaquae]MBU3031197.1 YggS family pyridoxal phosphate-dependent enzyme [Paracoccus marinaquae]
MGLDDIRGRIAAAERAAGRAAGSVTLIAVSKVQPADRIEAVLGAGQRVFGENYVQEAQGKWPGWRERFDGVELHMIGPLQSNKAKAAVELFDAIHTLDRISLARKLAHQVAEQGRSPQLFVQVNTGDEPQKAGILADELPGFLVSCRDLGLSPEGLMCIPPEDEDPVPHFRLLRRLADENGLALLSMGMSADFEAAIAEGATHVRVGSAIFGARSYGQTVKSTGPLV